MSTVPTTSRPPRPLPPEPLQLSPARPKQTYPPPTTPSGPRPNPSSSSKLTTTSPGSTNHQTSLAPPKTPSSINKSAPHHSRFRAASSLPPVVEGDSHLLRDVRGPLPGDPVLRRGASSPALAKQRSAYFEREFGSERRDGETEEGVRGRSVVVAEIKTNVFVKDETAFMSTLSDHLTHRYARPLSSIAITLQHGACLLLGGTFEPAYIITVTAIPSLVQPATNKRNAALLQKHLELTLGVRSDRGVVKFVAVAEDCLARGGRTVAADVGGEEGRVQRRRTIRTFSRLKPGSTSTASPPPPVPTLPPKNKTHGRSSSLNSAQVDGSRPSQQTEDSRPHEVAEGSPKGKGLRHKRSLTFVQSLFRRASKVDREGQKREVDMQEDRGEGVSGS